jgi:predicted MPP superfamily phosphohydrolase
VDLLPLTDTGNVKTKQLHQWIKVRKAIEGEVSKVGTTTIIECPFKHDVIIRFGKAYTNHPGTVMFRSILENHYEEHSNATSKEQKVVVTWKIIEDVEKQGGRFLVWDNRGWWVELKDRSAIRSKVAVSMKDHSKRIQALRNVQSPQCSTYQFERQDLRKRKRDQDGRDDMQCCR